MQCSSKKLIVLSMTLLLSACNEGSAPIPMTTAETQSEVINKESSPTTESTPTINKTTSPSTAQKASLADPNVVVIVNGTPITKPMYSAFHQQWRQARQGAKGDTPQEQMAILNELVNATLLVQDAEAKAFDQQPEVVELLNLLRTRALAEMSVANFIQQQQISTEDLKKIYDERYGGSQQQEFKARHILLNSEDEAKTVIKKLDGGADFTALAKSKSTGPSASQGGDLGWFDSTQMVKPFADAVIAMTNGTHSTTPVKTQFGWHVILREDARETPAPVFEEVQNELMDEKRRELVMSYLTELRQKADIQARPPVQQPGDSNTTTEPNH